MSDTAPSETDSLARSLGQQRVALMEGGRAILEYLAAMPMCHSGGVVQGGFVTGWIDAAMAHAVMGLHGRDVAPMTLEMKVSFFAPTRPGLVVAEGWIERGGKSTCFTEGVLRDGSGAVLAKASATMRLVPLAKVEAGSRAALA